MADLEDRLRRSLQARAADVRPDPRTWSRVSERIRRRRIVTVAVAGLGLAGLLAVAAVTLPTVLNTRVDFTPAPLATQPPAASEAPARSGPAVCGGDVLVAVFATTDGRLEASCGGGSVETIFDGEGLESAPAISPDGTKIVFERRPERGDGTEVTLVFADLLTGEEFERGHGYGPAFGPDGQYASFRGVQGDGRQPELVVPIGEELFTVPVFDAGVEEFTASDLTWDPSGDRLYWSAGYEGAALWTLDLSGDEPGDPQRIGVYGVDSGALLAPAAAEPGVLVVVHQCCGGVEGEAPTGVELGRVRLSGQQGEGGTLEADYTVIRDFVDVEGFSALGPFDVEPAGTADAFSVDPAGPIEWVIGEAPTWIVVSDGIAWLVSDDGGVRRLRDSVATVAINPAGAGDRPSGQVPPSDDATAPPTDASEPPAPATTEVQVYFGASGQSETGDCAFARAYPRQVETPGVARGALTALLAGPTQAEVDAGASSFFGEPTAGALNSVRINDGTAEVDFAGFLREAIPNATSSCGSTQLLSELDNTLLQFPSIERTRYSFDGDVEAFYAWLQRSVPGDEPELPGPTAQMRDRVRDAARFAVQSGDLDEIESLIPEEDFFCGGGAGACVDRWRDAAGDVSEAMGALAEVLGREPARSQERPDLWVWPAGFPLDGSAPGPGVAISDDGVWRQYIAPD